MTVKVKCCVCKKEVKYDTVEDLNHYKGMTMTSLHGYDIHVSCLIRAIEVLKRITEQKQKEGVE